MSAFLYGVALQWKLDIRSKTMLITCYLVPLMFFAFMGGIFTSINPEAHHTIIQSMTVFGVSMGALIGLPPPLVEIYGGNIKNVYKVNGVPLFLGVVTHVISAFIHLFMMSIIILVVAPITFNATIPKNLPVYVGSLIVFIATTLSIGSALGVLVKNISKLTMISQIVFLPSIMLSGIMFPIEMLPKGFEEVGKVLPATWGYRLMTCEKFEVAFLIPLIVILLVFVMVCGWVLVRIVRR
ncbi:ABC transporter permease [Anaerosporobacter sp.]|uniref:ABC transporter permease n=1 Tax=Anaerosporobacter sp. TaxID=1872529 RepID=UPI00286F17CC|nr:ABC transporter permease [Anaerosporobacter sp.]